MQMELAPKCEWILAGYEKLAKRGSWGRALMN